MASLNDSLRLIFPDLPEELVAATVRQRLGDMASGLAPIPCAGFECRLGAADSAVDMQQRILARDDQPARLAAHIAATPLAAQPVWQSVRALCQAWQQEDSVLSTAIGGCWLEFDAGGTDPSVFLSLRPLRGLRYSGAEVVGVADTAARCLTGECLPHIVAAAIRSCVNECPVGAGATDVGFMLGRRAAAVRLVLGPFRRGEVATFLGRVGEIGKSPAPYGLTVAAGLAALPDSAEQVLLSMDVAGVVLPRLGLEYFPDGEAGDSTSWVGLLDALVAAGLCTVQKRAALLAWPGYLEPSDANGPWPGDLLVESLLRRTDQFCVLGRRLHHVKIVCRPGSPLEAKVYLGYGPLWLQPEVTCQGGGQDSPENGLRGDPGELSSGGRADLLDSALRQGVEFLLNERGQDSLWLDFETVMGGSDEWVSAYAAVILAGLPAYCTRVAAREAARETWGSLCRRADSSGGWRYNSRLPADADATVWALRLARELGEQDSEPAALGGRFLDRHVRPDGSVASYSTAALPSLEELLGEGDKNGLCVGHACVSAAAAVLPPLTAGVSEYLIGSQLPGGWWEGYWWSDHEYTTALAVEGLIAAAAKPVEAGDAAHARLAVQALGCVDAAVAWARSRGADEGAVFSTAMGDTSPFATASRCRIILASRAPANAMDSLVRDIEWLARSQLEDGSWEASALMRVPPAHTVVPGAEPRETFFACDRRRVFTTATVVWTLGRALSRLGDLR